MKKSEIFLELLLGVPALGALVAGGALFAFSSFVMPALRSVDAHTAITSMQAINVEAPRSALMLPLVGSALTAIAAVVAWKLIPSLRERESPGIRTEGGH